MTFHLAIAGTLPEDPQLYRQIDELIGQLKAYLYPHQQNMGIRALISTAYTDICWKERIRLAQFPISGYCLREESTEQDASWRRICDHIIHEETPLRNITGEELCDSADLLLAVWNEAPTEADGATWELLQLAHTRKTPCIWLSSKTHQFYTTSRVFYESYTPAWLESLCKSFANASCSPDVIPRKQIPLLTLGQKLQSRYLKKHDADATATASVSDTLLQNTPSSGTINEALRSKLQQSFTDFDRAAVTLNSRYQAVMYWRSILPFITTIFLAIGFYAENVLGILPLPAPFWTVVAGLGFLIHGLLNLYVYLLSRSELLKEWHRSFINNRYIAEVLRVLIHFAPFGVHLDLRKLCGSNQKVYATIRCIMDETEPKQTTVNRETADQLLTHLEQMLEDQLHYHAKSLKRYDGIVTKLNRWSRTLFAVGFAAVVLRALYQFAVVLFPLPAVSINAIPLSKFGSSFANMLALFLPAWASYFSAKLAGCNYQYNCDNHRRMQEQLTGMLSHVRALHHNIQELPVEAIHVLGEDLAEVMLIEDTFAWHRQYTGSTIKHL